MILECWKSQARSPGSPRAWVACAQDWKAGKECAPSSKWERSDCRTTLTSERHNFVLAKTKNPPINYPEFPNVFAYDNIMQYQQYWLSLFESLRRKLKQTCEPRPQRLESRDSFLEESWHYDAVSLFQIETHRVTENHIETEENVYANRTS
jgi:hypothetical protein